MIVVQNALQPMASEAVTADELGLPDRLREAVEMLVAAGPRSPGDTAGVLQALSSIGETLSSHGYTSTQHRFGEGADEVNVIAECEGTERKDLVLEIGAHYDTVPGSPGADDNASGVAALLELSRRLALEPASATVRFCLFGREEAGMAGSRAHVARLGERGEHHLGAIVLESVGYRLLDPGTQRAPLRIPGIFSLPRTASFIAAVGNFRSRSLVRAFVSSATDWVPELPVYPVSHIGGFLKAAARSDHASYWAHGYRAMMVTDTGNFRNRNYHRPSDTPETLDFDFIASIVQAVHATVLALTTRRPRGARKRPSNDDRLDEIRRWRRGERGE